MKTSFHYHVGRWEQLGSGRAGALRARDDALRVRLLPFDEIARRVCVEGQSLEALQRETGCGHLCTACLPDLHEHLAARR